MGNEGFISYLPLLLLIIAFGALAYLLWRSHFNIGALIVQVSTAAFISTLAGYGLWVLGVIMVVSALFPESVFAWRANLFISMSAGSTFGYGMVKRFGTSEETLSTIDIALSSGLAMVGAIIGFVLFIDVQFGADFVPNASDVAGSYFGALLGGNAPLIVTGALRVYRNMEP